MVTGQKAFRATLKPLAPAALDRLVRSCLAENPDDRYQSAHDVGLPTRAISANGHLHAHAARGGMARWMPWAIVAAVLVAAVAIVVLRPSRVPAPTAAVTRFPLPRLLAVTLSRAPKCPVSPFPLTGRASPLRRSTRLASLVSGCRTSPLSTPRRFPAQDGATSMFWAPDGRSLAFVAGDKLNVFDLGGGAPVAICDMRPGIDSFGTWGRDGQIPVLPPWRVKRSIASRRAEASRRSF